VVGSARTHAATFDDFNDGDDTANPAWDHQWQLVNPYGNINNQTWTVINGQYVLSAQCNGMSLPGYGPLGYAGSVVGPTNTDLAVQVDIVNYSIPGALGGGGILARASGLDTLPPWGPVGSLPPTNQYALGALKGYLFAYRAYSDGGLGDVAIEWLGGSGILNSIVSTNIHFDCPNKTYTMSLSCIGSTLVGQVFEANNPANILAMLTAVDAHYTQGRSGVAVAGAAGAMNYVSLTVDNYMSTPIVPTVQSSSQVDTGWANDATAIIDPALRTITIPQSGQQRFYRLHYNDTPIMVQITSTSLASGNVVLTY
jgi:hypothetical protein